MEERGRAGSEGMKQLEVFGSLVLIMFLSSCMHKQVSFDEGKWRKQVEGQSVEKLYAAHFKDGRYFNPWMPMEHGGFCRFVKWKFSKKAGTFPLGDEPPGYPALDLRRTIRERNLDPSRFRILDIGQIEPIRKASQAGKG
jgi:hypothetical protein